MYIRAWLLGRWKLTSVAYQFTNYCTLIKLSQERNSNTEQSKTGGRNEDGGRIFPSAQSMGNNCFGVYGTLVKLIEDDIWGDG
jgi:hypothetical protein